jgi:hypothetical protein
MNDQLPFLVSPVILVALQRKEEPRMSGKYELQVTCKNPHCLQAFPLDVMPPGIDGPASDTQEEAVNALAAILVREKQEQNENLRSLVHDNAPVDVLSVDPAYSCPHCDSMYTYSAEEVFIQMPREVSTEVFSVDLEE